MNNKFSIILLSNFSSSEQTAFAIKIFSFLSLLIFEYPQFSKWYWSLYTDMGTLKKTREILICLDDTTIVGVAILKKTSDEKKVCTLRIANKYQKMGLGQIMLEKSFEILNTEKPLITIHISKHYNFNKLFNRYGFTIEQELSGCYGVFKSELSYNGILDENYSEKPFSTLTNMAYKLERRIFNYPLSNSTFFCYNTDTIYPEKSLLIT